MAYMDSVDMLDRANRLCRIATNATFPVAADWYAWFTEADNEIKLEFSYLVPNAFLGSPTLMATGDGGMTYTFGNDAAGNPIFPVGDVQIFNSQTSINAMGMPDFNPGQDYLIEGNKIRWPNNVPRTFSDGPYARFVTPTVVIDANHPSTLPTEYRQSVIYKAAATNALSGLQQDPTMYEQKYQSFRNIMEMSLKRQFRYQGAAGALRRQRMLPFPING